MPDSDETEKPYTLELHPIGKIPKVGDYVVCYGKSNWRKPGHPYRVIDENEFDVMTGPNDYWEKARFDSEKPLTLRGIGPFTDNPRIYRVAKIPDSIAALKVGDKVIRYLAGSVRMDLEITAIDEKGIHCGDWLFHPLTGAEIDEDLSWDGISTTGSYIEIPTTEEE